MDNNNLNLEIFKAVAIFLITLGVLVFLGFHGLIAGLFVCFLLANK